jgi:hypothetical protein
VPYTPRGLEPAGLVPLDRRLLDPDLRVEPHVLVVQARLLEAEGSEDADGEGGPAVARGSAVPGAAGEQPGAERGDDGGGDDRADGLRIASSFAGCGR